MKKLVVFGDSYANYVHNDAVSSWSTDLPEKLNFPVVNYGASGTSLIWSFQEFWKYFNSDQYDEEDIIVFIMAQPERAWVRSMPGPHLAISTYQLDGVFFKEEDKKWLDQNNDSNLWVRLNLLDPEINFDSIQVASCFSILAEQHKKNTWILLRMDHNRSCPRIDQLNYIITPSDNFFPYIEQKDALFNASINEFSTLEVWEESLKHGDGRINHLSKINRDILGNMIVDLVNTKDIKAYSIDKFVKNIYATSNDYENFKNTEIEKHKSQWF
jgi:hypothetical protein